MRNFTGNLLNVFSNPPINYFQIILLYDKTGAVDKAASTAPFDITMSDGNTYLGNGIIIGADPPKIGTSVDRSLYKIYLTDPDFAEAYDVDVGRVGCKIEIRMCFLEPVTGNILTDMNDTLLVYRGRVSETSYQIKTEEKGEVILEVICASPMADLDHKKGLFLSKDFVRGRNASDSCCDSIYDGSSTASLKWGKT